MMKLKGNLIKLSTFLKYGLPKVKKSYTVHVQLGSKYASVSITLHLTFLKKKKNSFLHVNEIFKSFI